MNPDQRFMVRLQWVWFIIVAILTGGATAKTFVHGPLVVATLPGVATALLALLYLVWDWQWRFARMPLLHQGVRWGLLAWGGNLALCLALTALSPAYTILLWVLAGESLYFLHLPLGPIGMLVCVAAIVLKSAGGLLAQLPRTPGEWGNLLGAALAVVSWMTVGLMLERVFRIHRRNEQLIRELRASQEQLRRAAEQERELALLRERERLARDLHDTVGYALVLASVKLEAVARLGRVDQERAAAELDATKQVLRETMGELRRTVSSLRETPGSGQSLATRIAEQARDMARQAGLWAEVDCAEVDGLNPAQEEALWRVAQEALTNVVKHAAATDVRVALARRDGTVVLDIADNGRGMPPAGPARDGHFGLRGMHERLDLAGGRLAVTSAPGGGTRVRAEIACNDVAEPELREEACEREQAAAIRETS